jgi:hypothetical protein
MKDELYNLAEDPGETRNLIHSPDPRIQKVRRHLNRKLLEKMRQINDPALDLSGDAGYVSTPEKS